MSLRRSRLVTAAVMSVPLLTGLGVAGAREATIPKTTAVTSVATMPDSVETSTSSATETVAVEILPPDQSFGGASRGEWNARLWQRLASMPPGVNPATDPSGQGCGYAQFGPV